MCNAKWKEGKNTVTISNVLGLLVKISGFSLDIVILIKPLWQFYMKQSEKPQAETASVTDLMSERGFVSPFSTSLLTSDEITAVTSYSFVVPEFLK